METANQPSTTSSNQVNDSDRAAQLEAELSQIYEEFGIGVKARSVETLKVNLRNLRHFAALLRGVEREFLMAPGEPSDDPEDEGADPEPECLVNSWGSTEPEYLEQFRAALKQLGILDGTQVLAGEGAYLVVDPANNHQICYATDDLACAQSKAQQGLKVYGPIEGIASR